MTLHVWHEPMPHHQFAPSDHVTARDGAMRPRRLPKARPGRAVWPEPSEPRTAPYFYSPALYQSAPDAMAGDAPRRKEAPRTNAISQDLNGRSRLRFTPDHRGGAGRTAAAILADALGLIGLGVAVVGAAVLMAGATA